MPIGCNLSLVLVAMIKQNVEKLNQIGPAFHENVSFMKKIRF